MNKEFIKFQNLFTRVFIYENTIEIKKLFKTDSINKDKIKSVSVSGFGTRLRIDVGAKENLQIDISDKQKIKDLTDHINGSISFNELQSKYKELSVEKSFFDGPFFSSISANIFGGLFLLSSLFIIFSSIIAGILFLLAGLIVFPKTFEFIKAKTKTKFSKKSRVLVALLLLIISGAFIDSKTSSVDVPTVTPTVVKKTTNSNVPVPVKVIEEDVATVKQVSEVETISGPTLGEKQAAISAKNYLDYSAFSRSGLIKQLEFEGFTSQQAEYGVSQTNADWNEQSVLSAQAYIEYSSFSRSGLITQLEFEGFTHQQAEYGAEAVGF